MRASRLRNLSFIVSLAAAAHAAPISAQSFPDGKPIEMTVMFGAGSAADVTARQLADGISRIAVAGMDGMPSRPAVGAGCEREAQCVG